MNGHRPNIGDRISYTLHPYGVPRWVARGPGPAMLAEVVHVATDRVVVGRRLDFEPFLRTLLRAVVSDRVVWCVVGSFDEMGLLEAIAHATRWAELGPVAGPWPPLAAESTFSRYREIRLLGMGEGSDLSTVAWSPR